jgi:hypothetical protein
MPNDHSWWLQLSRTWSRNATAFTLLVGTQLAQSAMMALSRHLAAGKAHATYFVATVMVVSYHTMALLDPVN